MTKLPKPWLRESGELFEAHGLSPLAMEEGRDSRGEAD